MFLGDANPVSSRYVKHVFRVFVLEDAGFVPINVPAFESEEQAAAFASRVSHWREVQYRSEVFQGEHSKPTLFAVGAVALFLN